MAKGKKATTKPTTPKPTKPGKPSALLDTRVIYCGDNLEQLAKLPDASVSDRCIDLIYIDPPFNSNRTMENFGEVFWGETKEKRAFEDRHTKSAGKFIVQGSWCIISDIR